MENLFLILFLLSLVGLGVGLVKPSILSKFIKEPTKKKAGLIFGSAILAFFILFGITVDTSTVKTASQNQKAENTGVVTNIPKAEITEKPKKVISYQVFQTWSIPNGGYGKVIIIPREYLNEEDMTALGSKIKNDHKNDRNNFIFVFTDKEAAKLRDKLLSDEMTDAQSDFYDQNYVGQYNKNANSGFEEFVIYFDGVMGTNSKTIKY